ncbi:MAG: methylase [Candidatus Saccharibacteria bacterium]|nr:methylase [Candidatus Saccharibacteria bacterium]
MAEFNTADLHKQVDRLMDIFFGAGVASHPTIIEQINYLLFMRALSYKDDEYLALGINDADTIVFDGELEKYRWENLLSLNAEALFVALEDCFRKIPESTNNKTVRLVFRNAHIKLFDKPSLRVVVHEIDAFAKLMDEGEHEGKHDIFGDTYEYLLSKLAQAGTSGQFRTPRHIIEFLVAVVAPKKGETILDPAVGTAGFLVKAFEYLRKEYTSPEQAATGGAFDKLSSKEHTFLYEHTFTGFDSDEDMIKFGMMNLYLHGLQNAHLVRQNTLTDTAGNRDKYDIILANPPFSGKIDRDSVAQELQMNTGATEVLFLRYMLEHLTDSGRMGVIVPEGVIFNGSSAHVKIRKMLIESGLWCVVSLPAGVFNPYAGVKTSIVFIDKSLNKNTEILFAKAESDGLSFGAQRRPIIRNDIPGILSGIKNLKAGIPSESIHVHSVNRDMIINSKDYNLNGDRYKTVGTNMLSQWTHTELSNVARIEKGKSSSTKTEPGEYPLVLTAKNSKTSKNYDFEGEAVLVPLISATGHGKSDIKTIHYQKGKFAAANLLAVVMPDPNKCDAKYLRLYLDYKKDYIAKTKMSGAANRSMKLEDLHDVPIPLPTLDIQHQIVSEIDGYQKIIDAAKIIVKFYKPAVKMNPDWDISSLEDVFDMVNGRAFKTSEWSDAGIPIIRIANLNGESAKYNYYSGNYDDKTLVEPGQLLFSWSGTKGTSFGPHLWQRKAGLLNQHIFKLNPKGIPIDLTFAYHYLKAIVPEIEAKAHGSGGLVHITKGELGKFKIPTPEISEQRKIVAALETEQQLINANKTLIETFQQKIKDKIAEIWGE